MLPSLYSVFSSAWLLFLPPCHLGPLSPSVLPSCVSPSWFVFSLLLPSQGHGPQMLPSQGAGHHTHTNTQPTGWSKKHTNRDFSLVAWPTSIHFTISSTTRSGNNKTLRRKWKLSLWFLTSIMLLVRHYNSDRTQHFITLNFLELCIELYYCVWLFSLLFYFPFTLFTCIYIF